MRKTIKTLKNKKMSVINFPSLKAKKSEKRRKKGEKAKKKGKKKDSSGHAVLRKKKSKKSK